MSNDGATINPHKASEVGSCPRLDGRTGAHIWVWEGPYSVKCSACGETRKNTVDSNRIIQPGVIHEHPVQQTD